jgi:tetratricopeptide (TPR) repeat protein
LPGLYRDEDEPMTVLSMSLWKSRPWKAAKRLPGDAEAWYSVGVAAVEAGRTDEAVYALLHSVELAPGDAERALAAAQQLVVAGCHAEAEQLYRQTMAYGGEQLEARAGLIQLLLTRGLEAAAREELDRALIIDALNLDLRWLAADLCERAGDLAGAADHLEAVLQADPEQLEVNRRLAGLLVASGQRARAIACLRQVVAVAGPDDEEAATALGVELSRDGQHAEALQILDQIAAAHPDLSSAHANLGLALLAAGHLEEAVTASLLALDLDGASAPAYCGLGLAYQRLNRLTEAADAFRATEQMAPDNPAGSLNLAAVLDLLGEREEARQALLRAAALAPEDREIREALSRFVGGNPGEVQTEPQVAPADCSIRGELKSFPLFDVLEFLRIQNKSGSLVVSSRHGAGIVRMAGGALTSASAPGTPRLGDALVQHGLLTRAQLNAALGKQRDLPEDNSEALGSILLNDQLIDRTQLAKVVFEQALTAMEEMMAWTEGAFSFHPADGGAEPPPISFSVQQLILDLMRARDEREHWAGVSSN